ncbi:MAG: VanW family protein [Candidatus Harrisonbacteria bacterium]|nr:VanW family protein [Candidatus Harrisonbacteria bacterium]
MKQSVARLGRIGVLSALLFASIAVLGLSYENQYRGRFYPGVVVGGVDVGGKAYGEVRALFEQRARTLADNGLNFIFEHGEKQKAVQIPLFIAGFTADNIVTYFSLGSWGKTIRDAYAFGRTGSLWLRGAEQLSAALSRKNFDMPGTVNRDATQSLLNRELKKFFSTVAPAQFVKKGSVMVIAPEQTGERVDDAEIFDAVSWRLAVFDAGVIRLRATAVAPEVTAKKLEPFLKLANDIARSARLTFYYKDARWRVNGAVLASWLTLKNPREIGVDTLKLKQFLAKTVVPVINDPPRNSRFEMRDGRLVEITPGKSGNVVDIEATVARVEKVVYAVQRTYAQTGNLYLALVSANAQINVAPESGVMEIPIETTRADPEITSETVAAYGIRDLVGSAKTSFKGSSADRRHNIEVGAAKLNGVLIAPGEEFSAVTSIGTTSEAEGFLPEFVIKDNKSVKELGGGLCQVATTLFRLALNAGLPVTERVNHRYVVSYYGPGLDATIYDPKPDIRFLNDTDHYLLLQGKVEGDELMFELYGRYDGRRAEVSEPVLTNEIPAPDTAYLLAPDLPLGEQKCSETPRKGITADVTYFVRYANGEIKEQRFHSEYQPWQKICLLGTMQ